MKEQLKAVMKAKTIREAFELIPWSFIEIFAAIPAAMFIISVIVDALLMITMAYPYLFLLGDMWLSFYILGVAAVVLYIGKCMVEKIKLRDLIKQNIPMIFFICMSLLILISTMVNGWTEYAIHGHPNRYESIFVYFSYFISFFFLASIIRSEKIKKLLIYTFIAISLIYGILVAVSLIQKDYTYILVRPHGAKWIIGIFNNPNHYAYYLNIAVICSGGLFALEKNIKVRTICLIIFLLNTVLLFVNKTMGCYFAALGGLIFLGIVLFIINKRLNKSVLLLIILFLSISFIINAFDNSVMSSIGNMANDIYIMTENTDENITSTGIRWILWEETIESITEKPIFGFGTEGISDRLCERIAEERTHNEYLQYTAFYGIPAGICYLSAILSVFIHGLKNKKKLGKYEIIALVAAFAYCFSAFFGNSRTYTAPYLFIFLGLGFGICNNKQAEQG